MPWPFRRQDEKLEAVLAEFCEDLGDLWTTHAVKLPYLADLVAQHVLGQPITRSQHKAWTHGVVTARAWGLIKKEHGGSGFRVHGDPVVDGFRLALVDRNLLEQLDETQREIVHFVATEFGDLRPGELGELTKHLNPEVAEWGGKEAVQLSEAAYRRLPVWYGEDEADAEIARQAYAQAQEHPEDVISDGLAEDVLAAWAR